MQCSTNNILIYILPHHIAIHHLSYQVQLYICYWAKYVSKKILAQNMLCNIMNTMNIEYYEYHEYYGNMYISIYTSTLFFAFSNKTTR